MTYTRETWPRWYCLYTSARGEQKASDKLKEAGFNVFTPICTKRVRIMRAGRRRERLLHIPLLVRYIFIEMDQDDSWFAVTDTDGVQDVLRDGEGAPQWVPRHAVESLQAAQDMGLFDETKHETPIFNPGEHVRITEGPFAGFPATVVKAMGGEVARVLVEMFGGRIPAKIELEHLRRAA